MCTGKISKYYLFYKYVRFAGFDWCYLMTDKRGILRIYDYEERRRMSTREFLKCVADNGMLNECYSKFELELLLDCVPDDFKTEIDYYLEEYDEQYC